MCIAHCLINEYASRVESSRVECGLTIQIENRIFDVQFQGRAVGECLIADGTRHHRSISVNMREVISELGKFNPTNWTLVLSDFMMNSSNMSLQVRVVAQFFPADVALCLV